MSEPIFSLPPFTIDEVFLTLAETVDWSHNFIGVPEAWKRSRGAGILVSVLDTGCQLDHKDLAGQIVEAKDFTGSRSGPDDRNGHGTHTAGTIGAKANDVGVIGIAPDCKLLIGKVLNDGGSGGSQGIANGIDWSVEKGASIISMSLGSAGPSSVIHAAIKRAFAKGVWVFASAGNEGPSEGTSGYPASHPECISVAAFDKNGKIAGFSSRGKVDIAGPGVNIVAPVPGNKWAAMSGTSMSCPTAAGCGALTQAALLAADSTFPSVDQFKGMLRGCSIDAGKAGKDTTWGWGLVDPAFLIDETSPKPPPLG